jgi:hypothetical protein
MISLQEPSIPYTLDLAYGIQVTVKPLTTSSMLVAQAIARQKVEHHQQNVDEKKSCGLSQNTEEDALESPALYQLYLLQELAATHIINWQGVSLEGKAAPLTPANIKAVMELYPIGEKFLAEFTLKQMLLNSAKNASGPSVNGTTPQAEGPTIAKDVPNPAGNQENAPPLNTPPKQ